MDDAVSEIIAEYAERIDAQERIAQAEAAVVQAAMDRCQAMLDKDLQGFLNKTIALREACAALAKARGEEA